MKKAICMIALTAICFGSVFANGVIVKPVNSTMQTDTVKKDTSKKKMKVKKTTTKKVKKDAAAKKDTAK